MYKLLKLNLARNSLRYIVRVYDIKSIYIPYYLCNVVRLSLKKEHCKVTFYHIDDNFFPATDFPKDEYILYPNYFGICDKNVEILAEKYSHLIVDNAHSFYSEPKGLACFNSARKFLPVYNGSYLRIKKIGILPEEENEYNSSPKSETEFLKNETIFSNTDIKLLNAETEKEIKFQNNLPEKQKIFQKYHMILSTSNCLKININSVYSPFCYPYLADTDNIADKMAEDLESKGLSIYRYWNELPKNYNEYKFYRRLVCIPLTK